MGQGVWLDSETLGPEDEVGQVLRHGSTDHRLHRAGRNAGRFVLVSTTDKANMRRTWDWPSSRHMRAFCDGKAASEPR